MVEKLLLANWDSQFFGFPIGTVRCQNLQTSELAYLKREAQALGIKLVYIFESKPFKNDSALQELTPIDQKVWYDKQLSADDAREQSLMSVMHQPVSEGLKTLALESGTYSRFKLDTHFTPNKFEELYTSWLTHSLDGTKAWDVLITGDRAAPTGLVTLEDHDGTAAVGLLAVSPDHRGKGLGKQLMQGALSAARKKGFTNMEIVTQGENKAARNLYEHFGFTLSKIENVYHLWSNAGTS